MNCVSGLMTWSGVFPVPPSGAMYGPVAVPALDIDLDEAAVCLLEGIDETGINSKNDFPTVE